MTTNGRHRRRFVASRSVGDGIFRSLTALYELEPFHYRVGQQWCFGADRPNTSPTPDCAAIPAVLHRPNARTTAPATRRTQRRASQRLTLSAIAPS